MELILAVISQESGGHEFDNELIVNRGYGIMQITGYNGCACKIECYAPDAMYYTNNVQGIYANIKDGLRILREQYQLACKDNKIEHAVWRYNHGGNDRKGDSYYLKHVAEKLITLEDYFGQDYKNKLGETKLLSTEELNDLYNRLATYQQAKLCSPGELTVYDLQGRVTGLVNGEVRIEIPNSDYYQDNVIVFSPSDSHRYEVVGTDQGTYGLNITFVSGGEEITFEANDIPTSPESVHQYTIDWDALSTGEEGVILNIDNDGDGEFEQSIITGPTLEAPVSVDEYTETNLGRVGYDRRTGRFSVNATVTNTSNTAIGSPVWFVIESINNPGVTVANADGTTYDGKPYIELSGLLENALLCPGESVATRVYFNNPNRVRFTFQPSVWGMILP